MTRWPRHPTQASHSHRRGTGRRTGGSPGRLSVVGTDRLLESEYFRAKVAQQEVVKAGTVPYTIVRATQFFEFIGGIADSSTAGDAVRLAPAVVQPEAAETSASALADIAVDAPVNGVVELAGPERFRLDELARRVLSANNPLQVAADTHARYFARAERPIPHPRRRRTHPPDPPRGLAPPVGQAAPTPTETRATSV